MLAFQVGYRKHLDLKAAAPMHGPGPFGGGINIVGRRSLRESTHTSDSVIFTDDKAKHEVRDLPNTNGLVRGMNY